ncbi:arsenate reductase family protein [Jannaschia ovalis]|uniref:ArsC/Spx/MgsR family protein n=1 Tax=Jannaschia ovalis TaxID=3038773 RepID=A0ABY8L8Z5_9RHOB|nr:ArsC/Spx/MgsR family protein [Jannaschia sp. GRR-S6-38]WGH77832.1 ArsC/Spx/MgsR family protein [Jannaschia sp. GRR-S6-38]
MTRQKSLILHGLKACDTCRKALKSLRDAGHDVAFRDLRDDPPDRAQVSRWHEVLGAGLLNTRSTTWRGLSEAERAGDPVALMVAHPALIKRPVISDGDALHLGWTPQTRDALGL